MFDRKFEYFLTIAELGNITKAAEKNYISQPSMTQHLNRLESTIGAKLFDRETSPLKLTRAGELYMEYIQKSLALDKQFEAAINQLKTSISGSVQVGIPLQMQTPLVQKLIAPFMDQYENIDIVIRDETSPALEKATLNGRVDCALIYAMRETYKQLDYCCLKHERNFIICSKHHPLVSERESSLENPLQVTFAQLQHERFFLLDQGFILRSLADSFFEQHAFKPRKTISMSSINALMNSVCGGSGVAIIPEYEIKRFVQKDDLAFLEIENNKLELILFLVSRHGSVLSPAASVFADYVVEAYKSE